MKHLLILTGPQGSGNHLFSKIFAESPFVFGWSELREKYWVPHDKEPFAEAWHDPGLLGDVDWEGKSFAVTSISCPYAYKGETVEPDYKGFIGAAQNLGYIVEVAIIGRDQNILKYQQERVRRTHSAPRFEKHLDYLCKFDPIFLSTELLYLYRMNYIKSLGRQLKCPVFIKEDKLNEIVAKDPNTKYLTAAEPQDLDRYVRYVSGISG